MTPTSTPAPGEDAPRGTRPSLSPDYGILPESEGAALLPWSWATDELTRSRNYWVCTTRPGGRPHAMPVWGLWMDGALLFSTGRGSRKARNLEANPAVVVHLESGDDVVILEGSAEKVTDAAWLDRIVEAYEDKYGFRPDPADPGSPFYAVRPRTAFAWRESDFPGSATRWRLAQGAGGDAAAREAERDAGGDEAAREA